jgi:clan AA aspartic protease
MRAGIVRSREARLRLKARGPGGRTREIESVIDTGYTGMLTLPPGLVRQLRLRWHSHGRGILADGSECLFHVYEALLVWDRRPRRVLVDEADTDPLVGMSLLEGYKLTVEGREGGKVEIKRLVGHQGPQRP